MFLLHLPNCWSGAVAETGAVAEAGTFHPVVVQGEKAVEAALVEGNQLVVDKDVDVFAVASEKGIIIYF